MTECLICDFRDAAAEQLDLVGGKAANLARLVRLGFPVPAGFVVTTEAYRAFLRALDLTAPTPPEPDWIAARILDTPILEPIAAAMLDAYALLGSGAVAVRSSATAEDLAVASFAGQYDTVLNVEGKEALLRAVQVCWASLWGARAVAYRHERGWGEEGEESEGWEGDVALAVVVQRMVAAEAAGVAFTANPVTGARNETAVSAVKGLGERLVSGAADADEWLVRDGNAILRRAVECAITAEQAHAVATMAQRIATAFGAPQDVEWAIAEGQLFVLQARPMTALPDPVVRKAPLPGGWMRNFRLGEWLPEPVTPLCDTWLLPRLEEAAFVAQARDVGLRPLPPYHVTVHGWYFSSPIGAGVRIRPALGALARHPLRIAAVPLSLIWPQFTDRVLLARLAAQWREQLLPRYQQLVAAGERRVEAASPPELTRLVDGVADVAGEYLWLLSAVGGHAWKCERALASFYRQRLEARVGRSHQELLRGLPSPFPEPPPHAVQSLDWVRPTLGESAQATGTAAAASPAAAARHRRMEQERDTAEAACRQVLRGTPRRLRQFEALLALAQRYAILREEQAGWFTLGWPLLRRVVLRLGDELCQRAVIEHAEDVFFLTRSELQAGLDSRSPQAGDRRLTVGSRRHEWERQRRLSPPLTLGKAPGERLLAGAAEAMRTGGAPHPASQEGADVLTGMPASPGRATGPVRVVRGPDDFPRFQPGEVLVSQATTPAWTPLFERAAAVVTDGGSLAAHASLVAREYGIPAVVGVGDATAHLEEGQVVMVDGSAGVVELRPL